MIISKTPLRVSFVGGGTDLPAFCDEHGGAVVSTSIDKWIHVVVAPRFEGDLRISYSRTEIVPSVDAVQHELVREALRLTGLPRGLDVVTLADVPSQGTGLGSSSAVTVGLLHALYAYQGTYKSPGDLAEEASRIEIEILGKPIGRQDQYSAAYGGFNLIEFLPRGGGVRIEPIVCSRELLTQLHRSLLFFYTGRQRSASDVLQQQANAIATGEATEALIRMRELAYAFRDCLSNGDLRGLGQHLHENWELKRKLADGVSDSVIDGLYEAALTAGADGGKLLGAGGGGFLLVLAEPRRHQAIRAALSAIQEVPLHFSARGTQIVLLEPHGARY
jgi:D-glycero-alpha-D-manno-heptose-7-phosphate kinase